MKNNLSFFKLLVLCIILLSLASCTYNVTTIKVNANPFRVHRGDTVMIEVELSKTGIPVHAILLVPTIGSSELPLEKVQEKPGVYNAKVILNNDAPEGLYAVHVWTGDKKKPSAIGKATFLLGKMIVDFCYPSTFKEDNHGKEISGYLQDFGETGGNFLIAHGLIGKTAHFPSKICKSDFETGPPKDIVEAILRNADEKGYPVLLSVSWDLTREIHSNDRMESIKSIMDELYSLYKHHPSLVGFYTYLEGSGTYFAPFMREFSDHVKQLNPGLLSGCSPYTDDPMLAGYLGIIESLDIIIYQGQVMASYRPDNRQKYPIRRLKDFCSLGIGAKQLQNKIALTHVELFGYLENKISAEHSTTNYENIYLQILSAATVSDNDGISFFTYNCNIHRNIKKFPELKQSRKAVMDGMNAFDLICDKISDRPNNLTFYFPHSDWVIERWNNCFLPALDAFRSLGIAVDILPYVPALDEDYPYWPNHANDSVMPRLLTDKKIIIFPDISGFKRTDSDWIDMFVKEGGAVIAFGPQIPMARSDSYKRKDFFGVVEGEVKNHSLLIVKDAIGKRISEGKQYPLHEVELPLWKTENAKVVATFEDGSPAIIINKYGKGTVATILMDATTASEQCPDLVRDVIDYTMATYNLSLPVDILGTNENVNIAVAKTKNGFRLAVINYNPYPLQISLKPADIARGSTFEWHDLVSGQQLEPDTGDPFLKLQLPKTDYFIVEFISELKKLVLNKMEIELHNRKKESLAYVVIISIVAALGGLLFGYDTAVISGAIGFLRTHFNLNAYEMGWAASCALAGCVLGVTLAGFLSDKFGRKKILLLAAVLFAISAIGSAVPETITQLIIFRIIGGLGVGMASMLSPLYIAEIAPARMRGRLVSINQFAIVSGILLVYFVNYFITDYTNESWNIDTGWRWMFASEALPALLFFILLFFVPESPRWLVQKNRNDEALNILSKINEPKKAKAELLEIEKSFSKDNSSLSQLLTPGIRIILIIGIVLAILQQVTGINVFLYYGPEIFKNLGSGTNAALLQTIIVGAVNLSFTIIAILVVDKIGRKPLLIFGFSGMGISLVCLGLSAYFQNTGLWVLIFILAYIASFAIAIGPVTWVVLSEIFPNKIRGRAMGLAAVFLWIANFVVSQTFPIINENEWLVSKFHHGFSFWIYAFMCVVSIIFVSRWIPETKGKSLEEIEKMLDGTRIKK